MTFVHELAEKVAALAVKKRKAKPKPPRALDRLRLAKFESDRRNYGAKHEILRAMMKESPDDFAIDSEENGMYGFTHVPTSFRIHAPRRVVPQSALMRRLPPAAGVARVSS